MARQFDICVGCRQCVALCEVFPVAFDQILGHPGGDAGECTPHQQDEVVDRCTFCGMCTETCIHRGAPDSVDIMAMMERMQAMRFRAGLIGGPWLVARLRRRAPSAARAWLGERFCVDGAYADGERIGCCGAGARWAGDLADSSACRDRLTRQIERRGIDRSDVDFGDDRCTRFDLEHQSEESA